MYTQNINTVEIKKYFQKRPVLMVKTELQCPFHFRLPFRFSFLFSVFHSIWPFCTDEERFGAYSISTLSTLLYTRSSSDKVYGSARTAATAEILRMGEWQASDCGVLCVPATRITAGTQLYALLRTKYVHHFASLQIYRAKIRLPLFTVKRNRQR